MRTAYSLFVLGLLLGVARPAAAQYPPPHYQPYPPAYPANPYYGPQPAYARPAYPQVAYTRPMMVPVARPMGPAPMYFANQPLPPMPPQQVPVYAQQQPFVAPAPTPVPKQPEPPTTPPSTTPVVEADTEPFLLDTAPPPGPADVGPRDRTVRAGLLPNPGLPAPVTPFRDHDEFQVMVGSYFSSANLGPEIPSYNYIPVTVRWGRPCALPLLEEYCNGYLEPMLEIATGAVTQGTGSSYVGIGAVLRYNYAPAGSRLVPYVQGGCAVTYNDVFKEENQNVLDQGLVFQVSGQAGVRWFLNDRWSIDAEGGYIHHTTGNNSDRSLGIHSFGATMGVSYFFRPLRK